MRSLSKEVDKYETLNRGCAAIKRGKLMAKTFGIALVPGLGGAIPGGAPVTVGEGDIT
jgi:hypothetical protein